MKLVFLKKHRQLIFLLIGIFTVSFILRLIVGSKVNDALPGSFGWFELADNVLQGNGYYLDMDFGGDDGENGEITFHYQSLRPPLYIWFYVMIISIFGYNGFPIILIQALIGALLPIIIFYTGVFLHDFRTGFVAAVISAGYPFLVARAGTSCEDNLYIPFVCLMILFILLYTARQKTIYWVLAAFFAGFAFYTRVTVVVFFPFMIIYVALVSNKRKFVTAFLMLISIIVMISPWLIRNFSMYKRIAVTDGSNRVLWVANNDIMDKLYPETSVDQIERQLWHAMTKEEKETIKNMNMMKREDYFSQKALSFMRRDHMIPFFKLAIKKALLAFTWSYNPTIPVENSTYHRLRILIFKISYLPVLILAICGIFLSYKQWRKYSILYFFLFSLMITAGIYWAHTRHTVPYQVVQIVLASYCLVRLFDIIKGRRLKAIKESGL